MKKTLATAAVLIAATLTPAATAGQQDSYGGVSAAEKQRVVRLIYKHFGSGYVGQCFVKIAGRESGFNQRATNWSDRHANGSGSFGIMQLGRIHVGMVGGDYRRLWDAETNIRAAKRLYTGSGFGPWRGCPN